MKRNRVQALREGIGTTVLITLIVGAVLLPLSAIAWKPGLDVALGTGVVMVVFGMVLDRATVPRPSPETAQASLVMNVVGFLTLIAVLLPVVPAACIIGGVAVTGAVLHRLLKRWGPAQGPRRLTSKSKAQIV